MSINNHSSLNHESEIELQARKQGMLYSDECRFDWQGLAQEQEEESND